MIGLSKNKFYIESDAHVLVAGATGTGKSYLAEEYLRGYKNVVKLDTKLEVDERRKNDLSPWRGLKEGKDFEVCRTFEEVTQSNYNKIIYAPVFEEHTEESFDDFFNWIYARQNTILWIDELMSIGTVHKYPRGLHRLMIMGRSKGIGVWSCTQRPSGIPSIVPANSKYFFIFNLYLPQDRRKVVETTGFDELNQIPEGHNFWFCKMGAEKPVLAVLG